MRVSSEFRKIVNQIRAKYIMAGKTPPSSSAISKVIAKKIRGKNLLENEFIRF